MVIATSTFTSDIILFIRNYLRTNLSDPLSRNADNSQYVLTAYPKINVQYPIVTIKNTGLNTKKLGIGSETVWTDVKLELRAWARNAKECDTMTQDIINQLRQAQYGTGSTTTEEIFGFKLDSCVPIVETSGDNTIHSKVMTFKYSAILS